MSSRPGASATVWSAAHRSSCAAGDRGGTPHATCDRRRAGGRARDGGRSGPQSGQRGGAGGGAERHGGGCGAGHRRRTLRVWRLGIDDASAAGRRPAEAGRPARRQRRGARPRRGRQRRQAARRRRRGDPALLRSPALLRRRRPGARGPRRRRVRRGLHVDDPSRAAGRGGPDHAVELPAEDGDLEDRAGAGRRQHDRAQAVGADAAVDAAPGRTVAGDPSRPACSTWSAGDGDPVGEAHRHASGRAHGVADRRVAHRQGDRRAAARHRSSACTSSWAARRR